MYTVRGGDFGIYNIIHMLDSAEPDIRFVVRIEADVGRSESKPKSVNDNFKN